MRTPVDVDRMPLVTSCIINVDQDLEEPWPIEVYSHDGKAHNVTMAPGDMVLYESHTVPHGRPFPMRGSMYANLFVHFKPVHHDEILRAHGGNVGQFKRNIRKSSDKSLNNGEGEGGILKVPDEQDPLAKFGGPKLHDMDADHDLISSHRRKRLTKANTAAAKKTMGSGHTVKAPEHDFNQYESPPLKKEVSDVLKRKDLQDLASMDGGDDSGTRGILHQVAQIGDLQTIMKLLKDKATPDLETLVNSKDSNGWQPIHEAVRGGHLQVVQYLVEVCGADISATTEKGGTALWWAKQTLNSKHPVVAFLVSIGAPDVGVEEKQ